SAMTSSGSGFKPTRVRLKRGDRELDDVDPGRLQTHKGSSETPTASSQSSSVPSASNPQGFV
ncbi:MAG: hypothetical protein ABEJ79_06865, partial [Halolamina sp.]